MYKKLGFLHDSSIKSIAVSFCDQFMFTSDMLGTLKKYVIKDKTVAKDFGAVHENSIEAIVCTPKYLFTGDCKGFMKQFYVESGELVQDFGKICDSGVSCMKTSEDCRNLFVCDIAGGIRQFSVNDTNPFAPKIEPVSAQTLAKAQPKANAQPQQPKANAQPQQPKANAEPQQAKNGTEKVIDEKFLSNLKATLEKKKARKAAEAQAQATENVETEADMQAADEFHHVSARVEKAEIKINTMDKKINRIESKLDGLLNHLQIKKSVKKPKECEAENKECDNNNDSDCEEDEEGQNEGGTKLTKNQRKKMNQKKRKEEEKVELAAKQKKDQKIKIR